MLARGTRHGHGRRAAGRTRRGARRAGRAPWPGWRRGEPAALAADRRAGHRQDPPARRAGRARRRSAAASCSPAAPPSSSRTCPSGSSSTPSTSTSPGLDPRRLESLEDDVRAELARVLPSLSEFAGDGRAGAPGRALPRASRGAASCSSDWPPPSRSCSCSTTCTGPTPASIELLGALLRRPPRRRRAARARRAAEAAAGAARGRARARGPRRRADAARAAARSSAKRPHELLGERVDARARGRALRRERRQPVLPGAARALAGPRRPAVGDRRGSRPRGRGRAARRGRRARPRSSALLSTADARACSRAPPSPATRSSPSWRRPRPRVDEPRPSQALDELLARDLVRRNRRAAPLPLPPPAGAHGRLRDRARRLGAGRARALRERARRARRRRRRRARTTSSTPRARRRRGSGGPARGRRRGDVSAPASAARWFGAALRLLPDDAPPEERLGPAAWRRPRPWRARGRLEESRADPARDARAGAGRRGGDVGPAHRRLRERGAFPRPPRPCPATPRRGSRAARRSRYPRGRGAHAGAGRRRNVPGGLRASPQVGNARRWTRRGRSATGR